MWRTEALYLLKYIPKADALEESVSMSERRRAAKLLKKFGRKADEVGYDKRA
jgi:hypothetical protein